MRLEAATGDLPIRLLDKCDDYDFHIINFPLLSKNIPFGPACGVYISQLIRYERYCPYYDDSRCSHKYLVVDQLSSQGYIPLPFEKSFKPILPGLLNTRWPAGGIYPS